MRILSGEAILLDAIDLHERDRIVTFLTAEWGKKRGVARGARAKYSRFAGQLQPLSKVAVRWFEKDGRELVRIESVELIEPCRALLEDLDGILLASYLAEHLVIGRKVAMKVIHPELSRNQEVVSRFITEAKAVNQIGHEHVVDISDFGTTPQGESYFIMEFLQGEALSDRLKRERVIEPGRALAVAAQVARPATNEAGKGLIIDFQV